MNIEQRLARSQRLIDGSKLLIEQSSIRLLGRPEHALPVLASLGRIILLEEGIYLGDPEQAYNSIQ